MKNILLVGFLILATSSTPIFAKLAVAEISPLSLGFFRFGIAALLFYITAKVRKVSLKFERKDYPLLALLALLCVPLNQFFFLTGIKHTFASHSGIIYSLNPVYAYVIAVLIKDEKFLPSKLVAILLTVIGIFFVFYEGFSKTSAGGEVVKGDVLLLIAVLTFSLYLTLGKGIIEKYGALKVSTFVFILGTVFYTPLFLYDMHNFTLQYLTYKGIIGFFVLTVVVAYIAYLVWFIVIKTNDVSKITTFSNISPVLAVLFSILLLGESISIYFVIGGIITLTGVFIMHRLTIEI